MSQFLDHLESFLRALQSGRHFALTRYGDGERAILQRCEISTLGTNRHWCYRPSQGISSDVLAVDLDRALRRDDADYYVGISDPCCNAGDYHYYAAQLGPERLRTRVTFANLFSNGNWKYLASRFQGVVSETRRNVVLLSNWDKDYRRARNGLPYNEVDVWPASAARYDQPIANRKGEGFYRGGAAMWYCEERDAIVSQFRARAAALSDAIVLVQLGPVANILIHEMFDANRTNTYLDMGHALDGILFGDPVRGYMAGEESKTCADMDVSWDL